MLAEIEADWQLWLFTLFAPYLTDADDNPIGFGPHHNEFWDWVWSIDKGKRPHPFIAVWPRGGAKSTSAEMACVAVGGRGIRRYGLYICQTQDQADDHVQNVAAMLESSVVEKFYPQLASRKVGKYGNSKGWRRNRLRTAAGFTLDAIGLDSAARGAKLDEDRPDWMVFDDLDNELDGLALTAKKIKILTHKLIPAGSSDLAVLAIQNLVHPDSIFARLVDGRADFLNDRIVSGPFPALENMTYEQREGRYVITSGTPIWAGQSVERCQDMLDDMGPTAFLSECQHAVEPPSGGMFDHLEFRHCTWDELPELVRIVVWVDPAVSSTDDSDAHGIQADGLAEDGTIYRLWSWEDRTTPEDALERAIRKAVELKAEAVGVETDQGGDAWRPAFREACKAVGAENMTFRSEKAGAGHGPKTHRASQMLADYERGRIVHVIGTHQALERALKRFPKSKPFDLIDAAFWAFHDLRGHAGKVVKIDPGLLRIGKRVSPWKV